MRVVPLEFFEWMNLRFLIFRLKEGTTRLIFAYGDNDPADSAMITYHGTKRGTKSVSLLLPYTARDNMPSDIKLYDFLNNNVSLCIY